MRSSFGRLVAIGLLGLLGCQSEDGGSSGPALDVSGKWGFPAKGPAGTATADVSGDTDRFRVEFETQIGGDEGGVFGEVRFLPPVNAGSKCPEQLFFWAGTLRGTEMTATLQGKNKGDRIRVRVDFTDSDTALGTYEYLEASGTCLGETGVIEFTRPAAAP